MLSLVLHYSPEPPRALAEVGRVVRTGGRVLVVDMLPHDREEYQQQMGHVWLGFSESQATRLLTAAGFDNVRVRMLPVDPDAKGPALFAAMAVKQLVGTGFGLQAASSRFGRGRSVFQTCRVFNEERRQWQQQSRTCTHTSRRSRRAVSRTRSPTSVWPSSAGRNSDWPKARCLA